MERLRSKTVFLEGHYFIVFIANFSTLIQMVKVKGISAIEFKSNSMMIINVFSRRGHVYHVESIMLMEINVLRITHNFQRRNCLKFCDHDRHPFSFLMVGSSYIYELVCQMVVIVDVEEKCYTSQIFFSKI
jgi:hypothetical protein